MGLSPMALRTNSLAEETLRELAPHNITQALAMSARPTAKGAAAPRCGKASGVIAGLRMTDLQNLNEKIIHRFRLPIP
jgi:hypothetical protein